MNHYPHKTLSIKPGEADQLRPYIHDGRLDLREVERKFGVDRVVIGLLKPEGAEAFDDITSVRLGDGMQVVHLWNFRNLTEVVGPVAEKSKVYQLDLRFCAKLTSLSVFSPHLAWLDVGGCQALTGLVIPDRSKLEHLFLTGCVKLPSADIHRLFASLPVLAQVHLDGCRVDGVVDLAHAPALQRFLARGCPVLDGVKNLPASLATLDCRDCPELVTVGTANQKLSFAVLSGCSGLGSFKFLATATGLRELHLEKLRSDKEVWRHLRDLPNLAEVRLGGSRFPDIPDVFCDAGLKDALGEIRAHFAEIRKRKGATVNECKILLLGNGAAGKTCLAQVLAGKRVDLEPLATHGIHLTEIPGPLPLPDEDGDLIEVGGLLRVWDFGGQDLYHNTHRIFMRTNAVYVVVWAEKDDAAVTDRHQEDTCHPLHYWLDQIFSLRPDAEIILVRNKADKDGPDHPRNRSETGERERWMNWVHTQGGDPGRFAGRLNQIHAVCISCREHRDSRFGEPSPDEVRRFEEDARVLRDRIHGVIAGLLGGPGKREVSNLRIAVKKRMEAAVQARRDQREVANAVGGGSFSRAEFDAIVKGCAGSQDSPDAENSTRLLRWLHNTGAVFWLDQEGAEGGTIIFDQAWTLDGIYEVFRWDGEQGRQLAGFLREQGGWFRARDLHERVWGVPNPDARRSRAYTLAEQAVFLSFMEQCGVAVKGVRDYETWNAVPVYFAPHCAPEEAPTEAHTLLEGEEAKEIDPGQFLFGRDLLAAFTAHAVAHFGRNAQAWFQRGRVAGGDARPMRGGVLITYPRDETRVALDWTGGDDLGFGGRLRLEAEGNRAPEAMADVASALTSLPAWPSKDLKIENIPEAKPPVPTKGQEAVMALNSESMKTGLGPDPQKRDEFQRYAANLRATVSFSFAGEGDGDEYGREMPRELYRRLIRPSAKDPQILPYEITHYQEKEINPPLDPQNSDFTQGGDSVYGYCQRVFDAEFPIVLLSRKYWLSWYCLWELVRIFERFPRRSFDDDAYFFINLAGRDQLPQWTWDDVKYGLLDQIEKVWRERMAPMLQVKTGPFLWSELSPGCGPRERHDLVKFFHDNRGTGIALIWNAIFGERNPVNPKTKNHMVRPLEGPTLAADVEKLAKDIEARLNDPKVPVSKAWAAWLESEDMRALVDKEEREGMDCGRQEHVDAKTRAASMRNRAFLWLARYRCLDQDQDKQVGEGLLKRAHIPVAKFRELEAAFARHFTSGEKTALGSQEMPLKSLRALRRRRLQTAHHPLSPLPHRRSSLD